MITSKKKKDKHIFSDSLGVGWIHKIQQQEEEEEEEEETNRAQAPSEMNLKLGPCLSVRLTGRLTDQLIDCVFLSVSLHARMLVWINMIDVE